MRWLVFVGLVLGGWTLTAFVVGAAAGRVMHAGCDCQAELEWADFVAAHKWVSQ
jgi:hypothetical protein